MRSAEAPRAIYIANRSTSTAWSNPTVWKGVAVYRQLSDKKRNPINRRKLG
jgi:hypothetical protein